MSFLAAVAVALMSGSVPQTAPQDAITQPPASVPATDAVAENAPEDEAEPRMVCRNEVLVGTRFPTRVCMRAEDRDARTRESRDLARRLDVQNSNRGRIYAPTSGGPQ